tara:strand:+ start:1104 stop:1835 length:732 start_codon:yes stop_codon:yes gene_type:complete
MKSLAERLERARVGPPKRTKKAIADAVGISTASVNDWFSGKTKTIEASNLIKAARFLNVEPDWLATGRGAMRVIDVDHIFPLSHSDSNLTSNVITMDPFMHAPTVEIPMLTAVASMGRGETLAYDGDQIINVLSVSKMWLEHNVKAKPQNLRVITGAGDSMHPTFSDGDMLLVDVSKAKIDIDGVYVLSAHERLFIKRVRQRMDGSFEVSSDNPTVKTVDILNGDHEIQVHGRVVWAWNGRAL